MSNTTFVSRLKSNERNIRHRCQLKYSKHGTFNWDKWAEYDCIFSSSFDDIGIQQNQLELYSKNNLTEPINKIIDLKNLRSLTCVHGMTNKNEPKDIIILKIDGKKYRLGFDNIYDYNQYKSLLDGVYNTPWDVTTKPNFDENAAINMLYESVTALRYRVYFADLPTQENLSLPSGECELIFDTDKLVLEQNHDKQYTFPRSTIRSIRLTNDNEIEFELGSRAPVKGFIRFRFESSIEARSCYLKWNECITIPESSTNELRESFSIRNNSQQTGYPMLPPRTPLQQQYSHQPPRPPPRSMSTRSPYYNSELPVSSPSNIPQNEYTSFHTLV